MVDQEIQAIPERDRGTFKGRRIASLGSLRMTPFKKYLIEVNTPREIDWGVECYVKAWLLDGTPVGLGTGGTVETERMVFINPPALLPDPQGEVKRHLIDPITQKPFVKRLRGDYKLALLAHIERVIAKTGKPGQAIPGTVGSTTTTASPNTGTGGPTGDAYMRYRTTDVSWATIRGAAAGDTADNTSALQDYVRITGTASAWDELGWALLTFDVSGITDTDTIDSATLDINGTGKADSPPRTPDINVFGATPAVNYNFTTADYDQRQTTAFATAITYANWNTAGDNTFTFNSTGLDNISKTGISAFCVGNANFDAANVEPTGTGDSEIVGNYVDATGTADDPLLTVVHSAVGGVNPRRMLTGYGA